MEIDATAAIVHRRLTLPEARQVHLELRNTPNILGYTVSELMRQKDVHVALRGDEFAGATWSFDLAFGWTEIAVVFVVESCRGAGIGRRLFDAAWERAESRRKHVYMLSRNPRVVDWMREKGMTIDRRFWSAPVAVQLHDPIYMANWYRHVEAWRKWRSIAKCPRLVQGTLRRR